MTLVELLNTEVQVNPISFSHDTLTQDLSLYQNSDRAKAVSKTNSGKWDNPYSNNKDKWVVDMINAYRSIGLNDKAIKNLLAKNALESGWGKHAQGSYNFGNLTTGKSWSGNYVNGKDKDSNGNKVSSKFRAYDNLQEFVQDEIQFLTKLYDFDPNDNFDTFIKKLQGNNTGHRKYAQAKDYEDRVRRVYNSI